MNGIIRSFFKSSSNLVNTAKRNVRLGWNISHSFNNFTFMKKATQTPVLSWNNCFCICNRYFSSLSDTENKLISYLNKEILAEQKPQRKKTIPSNIYDFKVKLNGSEVILVKQTPGETIEINFNINNSIEEFNDEENVSELQSKPIFDIDIKNGNNILGFTCSYVNENQDSDDIFMINEITVYKGEWKDTNYSIAGELLDYDLYNLMMNLLDEKGITNDFVYKMFALSTVYEHTSYISLLIELKKFLSNPKC